MSEELMGGNSSWHSGGLHGLYLVLGWFAFAVWSLSFWPQCILNYRRKSVVGLNFDFLVFNLTKHTSYLIFNVGLFFSSTVQAQYHAKYGKHELIPVSASDVAFSVHAVALTLATIAQTFFYERGTQKVSLPCWAISAAVWGAAIVALLVAWPTGSWLWLVTAFNYMQLLMTSIKYIPQAWFNFRRKSTVGWSISNILLDISGGLGSFLQMAVQSIDQGSVENFSGNVGKVGLSLETVAFDTLFIVQHYCLYRRSGHAKDEGPLLGEYAAPKEGPKNEDRGEA